MRIKRAVVASLCAVSFTLSAQTQLNPVTEAVMEVYAEELEKAPNDYNLLFARAYEYYNIGEYLRALDDVNAALKYTTRDDKEVLFEEYILRANIYEKRNEYQLALNDLNEALRLDTSSQLCRYQIATVNMKLSNYEAAKAQYDIILRQNPLNYEAIAGLAKVAVMQKNFGLARENSDKAVSLYPAQADVYVNRAEVLNMMGEYNAAAHDLLTAVTLDSQNTDALQKMVEMSNLNYKSVISALDDAINKAPKSGTLLYLRSIITLEHYDFKRALIDIDNLINNNIHNTDGIYYDSANANFQLGRYDKALPSINQSIMINPTNGSYYVMKSKILLAQNDKEGALKIINWGQNSDPHSVAVLNQKAIVLVANGDYKEAINVLNEAILNDSESPYSYMLRAWIKNDFLKDKKGAELDYNKVLKLDADSENSYKAFALLGLGRISEAKRVMQDEIEKSSSSDSRKLYKAAALYSMSGDIENGLYYLEGCLANKYGGYDNIMNNNDAGISVKALRSLPAFKILIEQYKSNFN